MDDSDKGFSSSTIIKPSAIPKFTTNDAGGTDENDKNCDKMASKFHNPLLKKPPVKHFMSPTISAASKASVPRKKILAERNEASNFTDTHHNNNPNLDSKTSPLCSIDSSDRYSIRVTPVQSSVSKSDDDEHNTCVSDSSLPYDPLTNYLSPRPKFLRYKPNRRPEILLSQESDSWKQKHGSGVKSRVCLDSQRGFVTNGDEENVAGNEKDDGSAVKSSACLVSQRNIDKAGKVPSSQESNVKREDEEMNLDNQEEDSDEEVEEFEKENFSTLKEVLKFILVLVILFLSTIYISSMNSPTPSPIPHIRGVKDGYQKIWNHTSELVNFETFEGRSGSLVQRKGTFTSDDGFEEEVPNEVKGLVESADELVEVVDEENQVARTENEEDGYYDADLEKEEKVSVNFQQEENPESESEEVNNDHNLGETRECIDQLKGIELSETAEKSEALHVEGDDTIGTFEGIFDEGAEKEVVETEKEERVQGLTETADGILKEIELSETAEKSETLHVEGDDTNGTFEGIFDEGAEKEVVENKKERVQGLTGTADGISQGGVESVVMGFSVVLVITALLLLGFRLRRKKTSLSIEKPPLSDYVLAEKTTTSVEVPNVGEEEHVEKVESFVNHSSMIRSTEEIESSSSMIRSTKETTKEEFYQIRAPTVELLGEFVVGGEEVSSSIRSYGGIKSKMMEIEVSSNAVYREKGKVSNKAHFSSSPVKPSASEFSTMNSPSHGSFTTEKKTLKKEEGGKEGEVKAAFTTPLRRSEGEVKMAVTTTPVRRSSRIRSRAVMSP